MHDHGHRHKPSPEIAGGAPGATRKLLWALWLTLGFGFVEGITGLWSGSLALLGDAGHMLTDSLSLGLAALAALLARRAPSRVHSYGLGRAEIMAALVNALAMVIIVVWISIEAVERLGDPQPVKGGAVMLVALIGLLVNLLAAWLLSGDSHNLNVRAALLHVIGDLLGSVAALISGAVILTTGWTTIDPLLSLLIVVLILLSAARILREALHALMEGVPLHLDLKRIGKAMAAVEGVASVHDLHIWSLSSSRVALSAHVIVAELGHWPVVLDRLRQMLDEEFDIDHVTVQPEVAEQIVDVRTIAQSARTRSEQKYP